MAPHNGAKIFIDRWINLRLREGELNIFVLMFYISSHQFWTGQQVFFFISSGEKIIHGHFCNVICNVNSLIYNTRWTNDKNVRRSVKNWQKGVKLKTYVGEGFATSSKNIMNIPHLGILQYNYPGYFQCKTSLVYPFQIFY